MLSALNLDMDQLSVLLVLTAAGLASVAAHTMIPRYYKASFTACIAASWFVAGCAVVFAAIAHVPLTKLGSYAVDLIPVYLCIVPIAFAVGLPYALVRRQAFLSDPDDNRRSTRTPLAGTLALSVCLLALHLVGMTGLYRYMRHCMIEDAVYVAARNGTPADIQKALDGGGDVNYRLPYGTTPLMIAAFYGRADNVEFLLRHGADPNVVCPRGETALKWAEENRHYDAANRLLEVGVKQ